MVPTVCNARELDGASNFHIDIKLGASSKADASSTTTLGLAPFTIQTHIRRHSADLLEVGKAHLQLIFATGFERHVNNALLSPSVELR